MCQNITVPASNALSSLAQEEIVFAALVPAAAVFVCVCVCVSAPVYVHVLLQSSINHTEAKATTGSRSFALIAISDSNIQVIYSKHLSE